MNEPKHEAPTVAVEPVVGLRELARWCAVHYGQEHPYTPRNMKMDWQAHDWVIKAMEAAARAAADETREAAAKVAERYARAAQDPTVKGTALFVMDAIRDMELLLPPNAGHKPQAAPEEN